METHERIARLVTDAVNGTLVGPNQLVDAFYPELKRLAASKMRRQASDHTWQPTVLVSELFLELTKVSDLRGVNPHDARAKSAFFALAAQLMQRLLFRHTRPLSWKAEQVELPPALFDSVPGADRLAQVEDLLAKLAAIDPQLRSVVELKVFEGLQNEEIAQRLHCSLRTVARHWQFAKSWLQSRWCGATPNVAMD